MPRSARPARWAGAVLVLALLAGACTSSDDEEQPASVSIIPEASTFMRVASEAWPTCLNPLTCDDEAARSLVLEHVLPKLMEVDARGDYVPSPLLAGEPEVRVDDETGEQVIVFVLDPDARWHDGRPITSSDVTGTWLARMHTPGADRRGHALITAVDDRDPLVARVTLSRAYADWPELFGGYGGWLLQADAFGGDTDLTGQFEDFLPFGAGPYELVSFEDRSLVLAAREDHWASGRQANIDQVRIENDPGISATDERVADELVRPGIDVVIPARDLEAVPERFDVRRAPTADIVGLVFDRRTLPLGSQAVRTAIDEAIDRRELLELVGLDADALITCLSGLPRDPACERTDLAATEASPAQAEALLDADGWPRAPVEGDDPAAPTGPRGRPDLPLATPVTFDRTLAGSRAIADEVAEVLAGVGFATEVRQLESTEWARPDRTEGTGVGVFAVSLGTAGRLARLYGCRPEALNPLAWCEEANQALVSELVAAPDADARTELQIELGDLAAEVVAWLPLHRRTRPWLVDTGRVAPPETAPLGSGPLGALNAFHRTD